MSKEIIQNDLDESWMKYVPTEQDKRKKFSKEYRRKVTKHKKDIKSSRR
jgi:hypothetical protein